MAAPLQSQTITFTTNHRWAVTDRGFWVGGFKIWSCVAALRTVSIGRSLFLIIKGQRTQHNQPATMLLRWGEEGRDKSKDASFSARSIKTYENHVKSGSFRIIIDVKGCLMCRPARIRLLCRPDYVSNSQKLPKSNIIKINETNNNGSPVFSHDPQCDWHHLISLLFAKKCTQKNKKLKSL